MLQIRRVHLVLLGALAAFALLAACGGKKQPQGVVDLLFKADAKLARNHVFVRVFQLSDKSWFQDASYGDLLSAKVGEADGAVLDVKEYDIVAGQKKEASLKKDEAAQYLGVFAGFEDSEEKRWKWVEALPPAQDGQVTVVLDADELRSMKVK